jgi:hypothetical protein
MPERRGNIKAAEKPQGGGVATVVAMAVARSCSSKEEGRGEAATEVKHTT